MLQYRIKTFLDEPRKFEPIMILEAPPGSPIGAEFGCTFENPFTNNSN